MTNLQSFPVPGKLYFKQGSLPVALQELKYVLHQSRILIVTNEVMLRNGGITPVTRALQELGLTYAVNSSSFTPDCVIAYGDCETWKALPTDVVRIIIPSSVEVADVSAWLSADMVILDEDLIQDDTPLALLKWRTLDQARMSLHGKNASDYTLAWAVQAMRLIWNGDDKKSTLLHAAALSCLAFSAADAGKEPEHADTLLPDAAASLGMSTEELENKLNEAFLKRNQ